MNTNTKIKDFDAIIYHGPCSDGTGGLWCACHYKPIETRFACKAGSNPTGNYSGKNVIFVDICPKIDYLLELVKVASYVVILDHHKSSQQMIQDNLELLNSIPNLLIEFDMKRSGCQMAWDYFFEGVDRPFFIDYMGDRDLWTWKLEDSKEVNTALFDLGYIDSYNLDKMTGLLEEPEKKLGELKSLGKLIETGNKRQVDIGISNAIEATIDWENKTYRIWLAGNINPILRSELGNGLCSKPFKDGCMPDFSACWQYDPKSDEWWISLRGIPSRSPDLSVLASKFGGGGHPMASGITIKNSQDGLKKVFIY
jgi:hypothetical protein